MPIPPTWSMNRTLTALAVSAMDSSGEMSTKSEATALAARETC